MLTELLHNKVYAILLIFFSLAIIMWMFNYFGVYEGMTSASPATTATITSPATATITSPATSPTTTPAPTTVTATTFAF